MTTFFVLFSIAALYLAWRVGRATVVPPDFIIGPHAAPYLRRWWILPRNRWFNIYLHNILRSDDDRALHDHPWINLSILLKGSYSEIVPRSGVSPADAARNNRLLETVTRTAGTLSGFAFRRAEQAHRLVITPGAPPVWTLFITGPIVRPWGFHCPKRGVPWKEFVSDRDSGQIGKGCGE